MTTKTKKQIIKEKEEETEVWLLQDIQESEKEHRVWLAEKLKEKILSEEDKKDYSSDKFYNIEKKVKDCLLKQDWDNALKDLSFWALFLWSSDIHYDCYKEKIIVRFRIDWVLVDIFNLNYKEYKLVLERLKYSAWLKLNITQIPQDWKYSIEVEWRNIDIRVSTFPTKYWENVVSRILDSEKSVIDFEDLWFFWTTKRIVEKSILKRNGMILVTWPTGSWKTTTLYTIINKLNTREKKIITLEDPIEYEVPWIVQSEVNEINWFTFSNWLRSILRQDPDVIMVWEIRDKETLDTATTASLTWHLVLSTLHTKSAAETLDRIINMWLKHYILASALDTIIAQRLVRKICPNCKTEKEKSWLEKQMVRNMMDEIWMSRLWIDSIKLYEGKWCELCSHSWYKWRIWIFEIISLDNNLRELIRGGASTNEIIEEARKWDLITMKEDWILKAIKGYTTIEELIRVL